MRRYRVLHRTVYVYSDAVTSSYGRAFLSPREFPGQRLTAHDIRIDPVPSDRSVGADVYGNTTLYFHVTSEHRRLEVTGESVLEVVSPELPPNSPPWEAARPAAANGPLSVDFALDLCPPEISPGVTAYAAESFSPGRPLVDAVKELTARINTDFTYKSGSTTVTTRVSDVFAARKGVCQDFARIGAACLRSQGLAARYVSGYLATRPPPGKERLVGVDATHAWTAVWLPESDGSPDSAGHWIGFDPTNNQLADDRYVTLAWGRDYADVPPLRGIIYTDAKESKISVSVDVAPLED
ncbi:transglutaminase family protein [Nocardia uniformis]|uniref:Transglutaminase family protein n=1 Tax=Nocardia uniformis TaxID=53432 RepID=A0A849CAG3_9NOCA|nr:transglutaminase family protein [Nocardia uniformis]NNH73275.1 transglutaminase family protein [Nocardia uniformis]